MKPSAASAYDQGLNMVTLITSAMMIAGILMMVLAFLSVLKNNEIMWQTSASMWFASAALFVGGIALFILPALLP